MLTKESIEALLKINTKTKNSTRALRIMSCDNPIKELFIFSLRDIKNEYKQDPKGFDEQLALCIYKFNQELNLYLNDKENFVNIKDSTVVLNKQVIQKALQELIELRDMVSDVVQKNAVTSENVYALLHFKPENYIAILQICGLVDISNNVFRSKMLSRILNIKDQLYNYKSGRMPLCTLLDKFNLHLDYISSQIELIQNNKLYDEDFLVYTILFDIQRYTNNKRIRVLK